MSNVHKSFIERLQFDVNGKVIIPKEYQLNKSTETGKRKASVERKIQSNQNEKPLKKRKIETTTDTSLKEYTVENILAHKVKGGRNMFLVKWKGWSEESNTWEPLHHLEHCPKLLVDFLTDVLSHKMLDMLKTKFNLSSDVCSKAVSALIPKQGFSVFPDKLELQRKLLRLIAPSPDELKPSKLEKAKEALLKYLLFLKREVQLNTLNDWETAMNKTCKEDALIKVENMYDLEGPPMGFIYINECIAMPAISIPDDPPIWCECKTCEPRNRKCCGQQSSLFSYRGVGRVNVPRGTPIYECNKRCKCTIECRNRVVQKGRTVPLCIYRTHNDCGWGVKALRKIYKGEFVCEYVGEIITHEEAERRGQIYDSIGRTYLFDLDFNSSDNPYTVDAATYGNISHFINHSCEPNLGVWAVWVNCLDPNLPKLALFALREIERNEQLTFDYMCSNGSSNPNTPEKNKENTMNVINQRNCHDSTIGKRLLCKCNTDSCRRYLF